MEDITKYLTVKEVSKKLGVTEKWVRDLIRAEEIKATKIGKWRIRSSELERFIRSRSNI
ncbi:MAG: helix-turn-helix domain-containing protein [Desulfobacteraceae bacterium]|nr:helix-turn-helix domain-containing protein [Desulfobacteraceae bacterium]